MEHAKLVTRLPLAQMISEHINTAREKLAADDSKDEKKVKKLVDYEKKEHGGKIPSVKEEEAEHEKKAGVDFSDPDDVEKLASALETVGEKIASDGAFLGGESTQGGMVLPTQKPTPGKQPYKHDKAKHQVPTSTGTQATKDNKGAATAVPTDDTRAPGGNGAKYPAKGVLKTAGASVKEKIEAAKAAAEPKAEEVEEKPAEKTAAAGNEAVDYILGKIAGVENGGESRQGGEQLSNTAPVPSNAGRQLIANNKAPVSATKKDAKSPRKPELAQVLTEPAMSKATDSKVHENLRNANKGGVKIAAARALLQKIAAEGCTCAGGGTCRHCKMKTAMQKVPKK